MVMCTCGTFKAFVVKVYCVVIFYSRTSVSVNVTVTILKFETDDAILSVQSENYRYLFSFGHLHSTVRFVPHNNQFIFIKRKLLQRFFN